MANVCCEYRGQPRQGFGAAALPTDDYTQVLRIVDQVSGDRASAS